MSSPKPKPKKKTSKSKGFLDQEKYTAELTSWQLVSGVIILIVFGLACFMLGVLVGKFEPAPRPQYAEAGTDDTGETGGADTEPAEPPPSEPSQQQDSPEKTAAESDGGRGGSSWPDGRDEAQSDPERPVAAEKPEADKPVVVRPTTKRPDHVSLPERPERPEVEKPSAAQPEPEQSAEHPEEPEVDTPTKPDGEGPESAPAEFPLLEPDETEAANGDGQWKPAEANPANTDTSSEGQGEESASDTSSKPVFSVQLAALTERKNAERFSEEARANTELPIHLFDSESGKFTIVAAGRFSDRESAAAARRDLRAMAPFKDCFVIER